MCMHAYMHACVHLLTFSLKKKNFSSETIDWTFTKFYSSVPLFIVTEKLGLWSDTGAQPPLVFFFFFVKDMNELVQRKKNVIKVCILELCSM